jgi:hypothetical protein
MQTKEQSGMASIKTIKNLLSCAEKATENGWIQVLITTIDNFVRVYLPQVIRV